MASSTTKGTGHPAKDRTLALDSALATIDKMFGKGTVMRLGEMSARIQTEVISTGCLPLDIALGVGGIPRARIIEIYGNESSGKTTLTYHVIAESQKAGGTCAFIDAEHALDPAYAAKCGVNVDELLLSQPDSGEQALDIADLLVRSGAVDCLVIDSVAALVPQAELDGEMGDNQMGLQARLMSKALRKLAGSLNKSRCCAIFINQIREKIGIMFGNPETTPGGRALKFWSSVRIELRRVENIKNGTDIVGSRTRAKVVKNKVAPPFKQVDFDIMYGTGISRGSGLIDLGLTYDLITKSGAFFSYNDVRIGHGRDNARQFLDENDEIASELEQKIRALALAPAAEPLPTVINDEEEDDE